ncbi:MAG: trypsin-like serine protease, partial [Winogradskyella sp.]|uniref:ankyrin repeat domain-containing protein n=1 Tax=Winogradskyella sp. TaxID=1883156 RepID=UPI0017AC003D|nr:trypsin-like serine protease [Winogradskyella sp.]
DSLQIQYPFAEPGTTPTRGIYGTDDRIEVKDAEGYEDFVRATVVMVHKSYLVGDSFFKSRTLRDRLSSQFETDKFARDVKFLDQPTLGTCTGFLIAPDILVTAGHCINSMEEANNYYWVLDYTSESEFVQDKYVKIEPENIFEVERVIASKLDDDTVEDYAVLQLTKKTDRTPYRFRTSGKAIVKHPIYTIGSPTGLPLKFATNAVVKDTIPDNFFVTDIDTFPGNSGGPVFNQNGFIEGIHVRGTTVRDAMGYRTSSYIYDPKCNCVKNVKYTKKQTQYGGGEAQTINQIPYWILYKAIYENLEYAIANNLEDRFYSWYAYNWIFNHWYADDKGRLEIVAIENNNRTALETILELTKEELTDEQSRLILNAALNSDTNETLKFLLDSGLLPDAGEDYTYTLLQTLVMNNKFDMAQLFISYGADINAVTNGGDSLLHLAAQTGNKDMVVSLLKMGLSVNSKNYRKKRPEWTAKKNKHKSLSRYLKKVRKGKITV